MDHYNFVGMHFLWWIFWIFILVPFFFVATPVRRKTARHYQTNPLGILLGRYASGEITTEDYEDRKSRIERDLGDPKLRPLSPETSKQNAAA
jgi:putative membrane protein